MARLHLPEAVPVVGVALTGQENALVAGRDVHVPQQVVFKVLVLRHVLPAEVQTLFRPEEGLGDCGEGHGMAVVVGGLENGCIGAGVGDVSAEVQALVDSGEDQVEVHVQPVMGKAHAVCRRGVHAVAVYTFKPLDLYHLERGVDVDAVALGALLDLGSHDCDFAELCSPFCQNLESWSPDSVIVGDKDPHSQPSLLAL